MNSVSDEVYDIYFDDIQIAQCKNLSITYDDASDCVNIEYTIDDTIDTDDMFNIFIRSLNNRSL